MAVEWYYRVLDKEFGPYTADELRQQAASGYLREEAEVRRGDSNRWHPSKNVTGLFNAPTPVKKTSSSPPPIPATISAPIKAKNSKGALIIIACILSGTFLVSLIYHLSKHENISSFSGSVVNEALTTEEIIKRNETAVVLIKGNLKSGTGFLVENNIIVTNYHVVCKDLIETLEIRFPSDDREKKDEPHKAILMYEDKKRDLAFLKVDCEIKPLLLSNNYSFKRGEDVVIIGNPALSKGEEIIENAVSKGILSKECEIEQHKYYQLNIAINPGNSGGPVIDKLGQIIGIVEAKAQNRESIGLCTPSSEILQSLSESHSQNEAARDMIRSMHKAQATYQLLIFIGEINLKCLAISLDAMQKSLKNHEYPIKGLSGVLDEAQDGCAAGYVKAGGVQVDKAVDDVGKNILIPNIIRLKIKALHALNMKIIDRVYSREGSYLNYGKDAETLASQWLDLNASLRELLEIPE